MTELPRRPGPTVRTRVVEFKGATPLEHEDRLATEEPLEIRVAAPGLPAQRVAVTMRTPGNDFELAAGWLVHEGIVARDSIGAVRYCTDVDLSPEQEFNVVTLESTAPLESLPGARLVNSACGVCGTDAIAEVTGPVCSQVRLPIDLIQSLPDKLRAGQPAFKRTGALHGAGLFTAQGEAVVIREDVGRHNAVDKAVGHCLLNGIEVPPVLVLSGRVGFELIQKAVVSGISAVVAVGAPTSVSARLAAERGVLLAGFTRPDRCVVYAGADRVGV